MVLLGTNLHQVGCAMRPGKGDGYGKEDIAVKRHPLTVIDHAGLSKRFGLPTEDRDWKTLFVGEGGKACGTGKGEKQRDALSFLWEARLVGSIGPLVP